MKTKMSVLAIIFSVVFFSGMPSFTDDGENNRFYVPRRNEEILYGTWVNENYDGVKRFQKAVYYYWGYGEFFRFVTLKEPSEKGTFTITDRWSDSGGNIWYKWYEITNNDYTVYFYLGKISDNVSVFEVVYNVGDFPTASDLNINNTNYRIRYRQ
jgi:hypothetical protein